MRGRRHDKEGWTTTDCDVLSPEINRLGIYQRQPGRLATVLATWPRRLVIDGRRQEQYPCLRRVSRERKDNVTSFPTAQRRVDGKCGATAVEKMRKKIDGFMKMTGLSTRARDPQQAVS